MGGCVSARIVTFLMNICYLKKKKNAQRRGIIFNVTQKQADSFSSFAEEHQQLNRRNENVRWSFSANASPVATDNWNDHYVVLGGMETMVQNSARA